MVRKPSLKMILLLFIAGCVLYSIITSGFFKHLFRDWIEKSRFKSYCLNVLPKELQHDVYIMCNLSEYGLSLDDVSVKTNYSDDKCYVKIYIENKLVSEFAATYKGGYPILCSEIIERWRSE